MIEIRDFCSSALTRPWSIASQSRLIIERSWVWLQPLPTPFMLLDGINRVFTLEDWFGRLCTRKTLLVILSKSHQRSLAQVSPAVPCLRSLLYLDSKLPEGPWSSGYSSHSQTMRTWVWFQLSPNAFFLSFGKRWCDFDLARTCWNDALVCPQ